MKTMGDVLIVPGVEGCMSAGEWPAQFVDHAEVVTMEALNLPWPCLLW
jgi:hypothetical protein